MGVDDLLAKLGPIIQAGAYAACVVLALGIRWLLGQLEKSQAETAAVRVELAESQKARILSAETLSLVIERNTVAVTEFGELVHDLSERPA